MSLRSILAAVALFGLLPIDSARGQWLVTGFRLMDNPAGTDLSNTQFLPAFLEYHRTPSGVLDLQGMTNRGSSGYWVGWQQPAYFSGGAINGGNFYRREYDWALRQWVVKLAGPSGYGNVPALAMRWFSVPNYDLWWWFGMGFGSLWGRLEVFGSAGIGAGPADRLVSFNTNTGAATLVGMFGSHGGRKIQDIQGMSFKPLNRDNYIWGITGSAYDGTPGDIFFIDPGTGLATYAGSLTGLANEPTGLVFDGGMRMYCSLGKGDARHVGGLIVVNPGTWTWYEIAGSATGVPVNDLVMSAWR